MINPKQNASKTITCEGGDFLFVRAWTSFRSGQRVGRGGGGGGGVQSFVFV